MSRTNNLFLTLPESLDVKLWKIASEEGISRQEYIRALLLASLGQRDI